MRFLTCIIFTVIVMSLSLMAETPTTDSTAPLSAESLSVSMQRIILGPISSNEKGYLDELALVIATPAGGPGTAFEKEVSNLVDAINRGIRPGILGELTASNITLANGGLPPDKKDRKYGKAADRQSLLKHLWATAQLLKATDPDRAAAFARATLLMAADDDFGFGRLMLLSLRSKLDEVAKIARLSDEQRNQLSALLNLLNDHHHAETENTLAVIDVETVIIETHGPKVAPAQLRREIDLLGERHRLLLTGPGPELIQYYGLIEDTWTLRTIAQSKTDIQAKDKVDEMLRAWQKDTNLEPVKRWIDEALTTVDKAPINPRIIGPGAVENIKALMSVSTQPGK